MGAWPDKSRTCAREAAVDQGTWQNFVLLKHLTFLHTDTRECRGCLKALWTHYHSVHLGLPLSPDLSFRCGRYRCSLHLSSWQAVAAAGAGVGRQGVTVPGMASRLPATATTEARQALAGRSAGSTRLLNMGVGGGWESRASHHRFHGNTQHQSHAATPSGWLDIKGREWWQSWTHSDAATPTTGAMKSSSSPSSSRLLTSQRHPGFCVCAVTTIAGSQPLGPLDWWTHCTERTAPFFILTDKTCLSVMPDTSVSAIPRATSFGQN